MNDGLMIFSSCQDVAEAENIAKILVEEKLAACVSIFPHIISFYRWEEKLQRSSETTLMIKTSKQKYHQLEQRLKEIHAYTLPEIISLPINGDKAYLQWISDSVK